MFVRSTVVALVVTATVAALSVSSSAAADMGHSATQDAMDAAVERERLPGVLGQAEDGGGVWNGASGVADRETRRPRLPDDRFRIGSLTKPFLAVVLLQLEAERVLDLDAPVESVLPGVLERTEDGGAPPVTLRQLLQHTSGVPDFVEDPEFQHAYFSREFLRNRFDSHRPSDLVRTATRLPADFPAGTDWEYSNTNYVLAGMVVEEVTGRPYAEEIERRVLRPLRLDGTSLPGNSPRVRGDHGRSYSTLFAPGRRPAVHDVTALDPSLAGASGEMISTTDDLVRFVRALMTGELLPPEQLAEMKRTVPADDGSRYGLGLTRRTLSCGTTVWGHDGTIHGSRSTAVTTSDGSHTAAFNLNGDWAGDTLDLLEAEFCPTRPVQWLSQ
ncbi:serine hydrolase domain-containing protein [Streptomyces sp. HNM0574]|uniref:serine hydrolase domain-containing protein n=1 Tax=Streptomyces sp. HNM0574 TaxID=2714954 RepID=UPI00146C0DA0|nr:serine hydrolase domain-containing protein [Streptomyces sp. HNM0574]NLU66400.1 beta-lactamase family protein [Streptomyces sp. HNM0574]